MPASHTGTDNEIPKNMVRVRVSDGCCVCGIDYPGFGEFFWSVKERAPLCENCSVSSQEYDDEGAEMHRHIHVYASDGCSVCGVDCTEHGVFFWNEKSEAPMCENCAISSIEGETRV